MRNQSAITTGPECANDTEKMSALLAIFRSGYGDYYAGDKKFAETYINRAHAVIQPEDKLGAALVRFTRITAICIVPETDNRRDRLTELFRIVRVAEDDSWISIGVSSPPGVALAAYNSGMEQVQSKTYLEKKLDDFGGREAYDIFKRDSGLNFTRPKSDHGANYEQSVWAWPQ